MTLCLIQTQPYGQKSQSVAFRMAEFITLIEPIVGKVWVMTTKSIAQDVRKLLPPDSIKVVGSIPDSQTGFARLVVEPRIQLKICHNLLMINDYVDTLFWRARITAIPLPLLLARILRKRSALFVESLQSERCKRRHMVPHLVIFGPIYRALEAFCHGLVHKMVTNVPNLAMGTWARRYDRKVFSQAIPSRILSPDLAISVELQGRKRVVGYIGRMTKEKGILKLVEAIKLVDDTEFILAGGGPELETVKARADGAKVLRWIPHNEIGDYLNTMRLLVLPSESEGLPTVVLEAMACGTPVLATSIGAVPDIIHDGQTGFIMRDNSPECIASNIKRALNHPGLERISEQASNFVRGEYCVETVRGRWHDFFKDLLL